MTIDDQTLVDAFKQNDFDLAGLADIAVDQAYVDRCLCEIYLIVKNHSRARRTNESRLAQVLLGMMAVAQEEYATSGYAKYWGFLFDRIRQAIRNHPRFQWSSDFEHQQYQALLGEWFRAALDAFGYSIPKDGRTNLRPILFHAGIPHTALPDVLHLIALLCEQMGGLAENLPADVRSSLVKCQSCALQSEVRLLLTSNLLGAFQLWRCLTRVVLAWQATGECDDELLQLPEALDPAKVREALPFSIPAKRGEQIPLPQLRFDSETGEVRLCVPRGTAGDWNLRSRQEVIAARWTVTHLGATADFQRPLPDEVIVQPQSEEFGVSRTFTPRPSEWPGYWFHARNGNIEDGRTIDASGLEAGRWYALFEGTPSRSSVPLIGQVMLNWSWFSGLGEWTAWEVDVPPRSSEQTHLEWVAGDQLYRVPLARHSGPRVQCDTEPTAVALNESGERVQVFSSAPVVTSDGDHPLQVMLLRELSESVTTVRRFELAPGSSRQLPIKQPGIYQLRQAKGVGRTLLHFAVLPDFSVTGPNYNPTGTRFTIQLKAASELGKFDVFGDQDVDGHGTVWRIEDATIEPLARAKWQWANEEQPGLEFSWSIEGLRWRVLRLTPDLARWTRDPLFVSPKDVAAQDAQLEIQVPAGSEFSVNDIQYSGPRRTGATGDSVVLSLNSYGDSVAIAFDGKKLAAVILSERPLVDRLEAVADEGTLLLSWDSGSDQEPTTILAWDPCAPLSEPTLFNLNDEQTKARQWEYSLSELPGKRWTSIALARSAGGFFKRILHLAARKSQTLEPVSILFDRDHAEAKSLTHRPSQWSEFLHHVSLFRFDRRQSPSEFIRDLLSGVSSVSTDCLGDALVLASDLIQAIEDESAADHDLAWAKCIIGPIEDFLQASMRKAPIAFFSDGLRGSNEDRLQQLLHLGLPVGGTCPFHWLQFDHPLPDVPSYPFEYLVDLWLLGTGREVLEGQLRAVNNLRVEDYHRLQETAAARVFAFHRQWKLPPVYHFLPVSRSTAAVDHTSCAHHHAFALPPASADIDSVEEFQEALGLSDKAIDCDPTCDDQFFSTTPRMRTRSRDGNLSRPDARQYRYSLYWCSDEGRWAIEMPSRSTPTCCWTEGEPLRVAPWKPRELAERLGIRRLLSGWEDDDSQGSCSLGDLSSLDILCKRLLSDNISGPLHKEIILPPETETAEVLGAVIEVHSKTLLSPRVIAAWQLAWIERLSAWNRGHHFFGVDEGAVVLRKEFVQTLGKALQAWPNLMRRSLALAEILYWTLYREGLGFALRYRDGPATSVTSIHSKSTTSQGLVASVYQPPAKPDSDCIADVTGVILGYDAGIGLLLVHHTNSPSLHDTVADFVQSGDRDRHWLARFRWGEIGAADQRYAQELFAKNRQAGHSMHRTVTLSSVLVGASVRCKLCRTKYSWEAGSLRIDFKAPRASIPSHRQHEIREYMHYL